MESIETPHTVISNRLKRIRIPLHMLQKHIKDITYHCPIYNIDVVYMIRYNFITHMWVASYRSDSDTRSKILYRHRFRLYWAWDGASVPDLVLSTDNIRPTQFKIGVVPRDAKFLHHSCLPKPEIPPLMSNRLLRKHSRNKSTSKGKLNGIKY